MAVISQTYPVVIYSPPYQSEWEFVVPLFEIGDRVLNFIYELAEHIRDLSRHFKAFTFLLNKNYNENMRVHTILVSPTTLLLFLLGGWIVMLCMIQFTSVPVAGAQDMTVNIEFPEGPALKKLDKRFVILQSYLSQFDSPLKEHAQDFLDAADTYGVDWRLIPAIAGVESTFGKRIPGGHDPEFSSYNGWGWGVYGDHMIKFKSWREAIFTVTKGVKEGYLNQGLTDPMAMNKKYASSPVWGEHVTYFLTDMNGFVNSHHYPDQYIYEPHNLEDGSVFQNDAYLKVNGDRFETQLVD